MKTMLDVMRRVFQWKIKLIVLHSHKLHKIPLYLEALSSVLANISFQACYIEIFLMSLLGALTGRLVVNIDILSFCV